VCDGAQSRVNRERSERKINLEGIVASCACLSLAVFRESDPWQAELKSSVNIGLE
jgi:hypothetical protein